MKIAIIGAGISGLTLAAKIQRDFPDCQVDVFEKAKGRAGRLSSRRYSWGSADIGAQYFTARTPAFMAEVELWLQHGWVVPWHTETAIWRDDTLSYSKDEQVRFVGVPYMSYLCQHLAQQLNIHLQHRVQKLQRVQNQWQLWGGAEDEALHSFGCYDWVISTAPSEQTALLFANTGSQLLAPIKTRQHSPCSTVVLAYEATHRVLAQLPSLIFVQDSQVQTIVRDSSKPLRQGTMQVFVVQFTAEFSREHSAQSAALLTEIAQQYINKMAGAVYAPLATDHHYWRFAKSEYQQVFSGLVDAELGLAICGDSYTQGKVEHAFISAKECASALAPLLQQQLHQQWYPHI